MTPLEEGTALPRGLRIHFGLVLAFFATFVATAPWRIDGRDVGRFSFALWIAVSLCAAALLYPPWRRSLLRFFSCSDVRLSNRAVLVAAAGASLFLGRIVFCHWASLETSSMDLSLFYHRPLAETFRGRFLYCDYVGYPLLGHRAHWIILVFLPFYAVVVTPIWLLAAHAGALAAAFGVSFFYFRRALEDDLSAAFLSGAFLLNTYTAKGAQFAFHPEIFYPLALFLLLYAYQANRPLVFGAAVLLTASIKEDAVLPLIGFAIAAALFDRRFKSAAWAAGVGLTCYVVAAAVVLPHFSGRPSWQPEYASYWAAYGRTPPEAALAMATDPLRLAGDIARSGLADLLEPLIFLPLAGFRWFVAVLPALVPFSVASAHPRLSQFGQYYAIPVLPFLFAATADGIRRIEILRARGASSARLRSRRRVLTLCVLLVCALDGGGYTFRRGNPARHEILPTLAAIGDRPVRIQDCLFPHAGAARNQRLLELSRPASADEAILLALGATPYPYTKQDLDALASRLSADPRYRRTETPRGLLLFTPVP